MHMAMENNELWESILSEVEIQVARPNFLTWLKNRRLVKIDDSGTAYVAFPNHFAKEWVEAKYHKMIIAAIRNRNESVKKVEYLVEGGLSKIEKQKPIEGALDKKQLVFQEMKVDQETNLNPRYTLASYVVGSSNELVHSAALAVIESIGTKYNPFFIYGGVGLGKTHLIQAIGNEITARSNKKIKVKYVTSEKFTNDVVWAIRNRRMEDIKAAYRLVDVLIIDDIQFIGGKEKTEEEFFHTFNALYETNKQIIISSDRPPQSIPTLEERLRSRFEGGLITDIGYPEYEMRMAIIKNKLQESNRELRDEIVDLVARKVKKNIRELVGVVNKIIFYQDVKKTEITEKIAEEIIEKSIRNFARKVSDDHILKSVAEFFNISISDLIEKGRRKEVVEPRQVAMFLMREILDVSYPYIGEKLGRDHTTAIHAVEKINQEIAKNSALNQKINLIKEVIFKT